MKKFLMTTVYLFFGLVFLGGFSAGNPSWAEVAVVVLKEAQELKKLENEYFNKRLNDDLRVAYQYQHPKYQKQISIENSKLIYLLF